jgi:ribosomal protein L40E
MRFRFAIPALLLAIIGLTLSAAGARAQTQPSVSQLTVSFWPEYDRPEVLVIYRLTLAAATPLPIDVNLPVPDSVADMNAVATRNAAGTLVDADYTRQQMGGRSFVVVHSNSLDVQIEYYLPLARTGDTRSFQFTWPGGLGAADFRYEVQQPVGATSLHMDPPSQSQLAGEFGLTYQQAGLGNVDAAAQPSLSVTYERTTDQLSADFVQAQTPIGTPQPAGGRTPDLVRYLPWALLALGLALMAGGAIYYIRTMRPSRRERRRHPSAAAEPAAGDDGAATVYCHNCGARAGASDRYCRNCGTQLRRKLPAASRQPPA